MLQTSLSAALREQCVKADLRYEELSAEERDSYVLGVVETLLGDDLLAAGEGRLPDWEEGWERTSRR